MKRDQAINPNALSKLLKIAGVMVVGALLIFVPLYWVTQQEEPDQIKGKVVSLDDQEGIKEVEVRWMNGTQSMITHTDEQGNFAFKREKNQQQFGKISLFHPDFRPKIEEIPVSDDEGESMDVDLGNLTLNRVKYQGQNAAEILDAFSEVQQNFEVRKQALKNKYEKLQQKGTALNKEEEIQKIMVQGKLQELELHLKYLRDDSLLYELKEVDGAYANKSLEKGKKALTQFSIN